jgi:signal transduction histidine kinase/ActR/RegA family two-component response regulator
VGSAIGSRLARLHQVTRDLASALDTGRIAEVLIDNGVEAVGASTGALYLVEPGGGELRLVRSVGFPEPAGGAYQRVSLEGGSPLARSVQSGAPVLLASREDYAARFPGSEQRSRSATRSGIGAIACVPLVPPGGDALGGLSFAFEGVRAFDAEDEAFLLLLAHHGAEALRRAGLFEREAAAARQAEEASRMKDEFLATISHELRAPLSTILGWARELAGERGRDPDEVRRGAQVLERNARAQLRLIDDLLDVSRIVRGQLRLETAPLEIAPLVRDVVEGMRPSAEARQIEVALELDPDVRLVADPDRLRQILWNLLANAFKFTAERGRVGVRAAQDGARVRIVVADDGRGIDADFLPHVFERFSQAQPGGQRGLGLGLAIVRHLVEMHGGTVSARSDGVGRGASFEVMLPIRPFETEPTRSAAGAAEGEGTGPLAGLRVLVVEDDPDSRELIEVLLTSEGATVESADTAEDALEKLDAFDPALLVSDIGMPHHDGLWLVARVRERRPDLPAIALTALTRREDAGRILAAGFDHHVGKPVDPDHLVTLAAAAVARRAEAEPGRTG